MIARNPMCISMLITETIIIKSAHCEHAHHSYDNANHHHERYHHTRAQCRHARTQHNYEHAYHNYEHARHNEVTTSTLQQ